MNQYVKEGVGSTFAALATMASANSDTYINGSITKYAKDLIMSFPVLCDNSIDIETIQLITKAHERNIVSILEIVLSSLNFRGDNGVEIVKKLHTNINNNDVEAYIDNIEKITYEQGLDISPAEIRMALNELARQVKIPQKSYPVSSFSEKSLNDYIVNNINGKEVVQEALPPFITNVLNPINTATNAYKGFVDQQKFNYQREKDARDREYQRQKDEKEEKERQYKHQQDELTRRKEEYERQFNLLKSRTKDVDYKKANELQPTPVFINFITSSDRVKTVIAGVKARTVGVDAQDIVERVMSKEKNKISFNNFIRATTGEIKFFRDFINATKDMKNKALKDVKDPNRARIWNALERRSGKNVTNQLIKSNDASAISTLVVNQETANYLMNAYSYNILDTKVAAELMSNFNLLCLVIADETNEVAKFLYDNNNAFEQVAYSSLSRDAAENKAKKETINLINRTGR